jgi:hypothetical protein
MTAPNKEKRLIREMEKSYAANRALLVESMNECSKGTSSYRQHVADLDRLDRSHREEMAARGVTPENLGQSAAQQFVYVSHVSTIPSNREELNKLLGKQMAKASKGVHYSKDDDFVRRTLETMTYEESVIALEERGIKIIEEDAPEDDTPEENA